MISHGKTGTPEYWAWTAMHSRCRRKNHPHYGSYGGRGIRVCERWGKFENFLADMGRKPSPEHSLERIDVNGNYEPGNCRWDTWLAQNRNRRNNCVISYRGEQRPQAEWAEIFGMSRSALNMRLNKYGWPIEKALETPVRKRSKTAKK